MMFIWHKIPSGSINPIIYVDLTTQRVQKQRTAVLYQGYDGYIMDLIYVSSAALGQGPAHRIRKGEPVPEPEVHKPPHVMMPSAVEQKSGWFRSLLNSTHKPTE